MNSDTTRHENSPTPRLRAAVSESKLGQFVAVGRTAAGESVTAQGVDTLEHATHQSRVVSTGRRATARVGELTRRSSLFRWLTAEPEPEIIVIDLRETWTVGPFIALLDRFVAAAEPHIASLGIGTAARRLTNALSRAPVRIAGLLSVFLFSGLVAAALLTGTLTRPAMGAYAIVLGLALAATRVGLSWRELGETKFGNAVAAAFEPPEYDDRR
ncbi:hypothetical protein [Haladaptatus sp. DJG-WS-42]|uniref:hypothetical protein n=1 Tax=Haladaptatus sp. DJG-WS-42 TaxID=3120516 RepID=UPI0030CEFE0C